MKTSVSFGLKEAKHLEALSTKEGVALEIYKRTKDEENNRKTFRDIIAAMKSAGVLLPKNPG